MKNIVSALLNFAEAMLKLKNTYGFRIVSDQKLRVSPSFRNTESYGVPNSRRFPSTKTCRNLAISNTFSMWNLFGNLAYVQISQLKLAETSLSFCENPADITCNM